MKPTYIPFKVSFDRMLPFSQVEAAIARAGGEDMKWYDTGSFHLHGSNIAMEKDLSFLFQGSRGSIRYRLCPSDKHVMTLSFKAVSREMANPFLRALVAAFDGKAFMSDEPVEVEAMEGMEGILRKATMEGALLVTIFYHLLSNTLRQGIPTNAVMIYDYGKFEYARKTI